MAPAVPPYAPRDPSGTVLSHVIAEHLETFFASCHDDPDGAGLPAYVERAFYDYLRCGILAHGFLRLGCDTCHKELLVPFSGKRRGFCPSCAGRRMAQTAAHLVEQVILWVPTRQWVVSVPIPLRYWMASSQDLTAKVHTIMRTTIGQFYVNQAVTHGHERAHVHPGSVTFLQRFGSALNVNLHCHGVFLEGVSLDRTAVGLKPRFLAGAPPIDTAIAAVIQKISRRVLRTLRRLGYLETGLAAPVATGYDPLRDTAPELARTMAASVQQRIAFGARAGQHVRRIGAGFGMEGEAPRLPGPRCARVHGFSLHAHTAVPAHRRDQLEQLIRSTARGAVSLARLQQDANGDLVYTFTHPWSDGSMGIRLAPLELLEKLAALVPLPHVHLVRYGGCLAPHSHLRGAIVPTPRQQGMEGEATQTGTPYCGRGRGSWGGSLASSWPRAHGVSAGPCGSLPSSRRARSCARSSAICNFRETHPPSRLPGLATHRSIGWPKPTPACVGSWARARRGGGGTPPTVCSPGSEHPTQSAPTASGALWRPAQGAEASTPAAQKGFCTSYPPRHSHYVRVRLGGVTIWRLQCTTCKAAFTVLPHFVLRYRSMRPEVARDALLATHGGLSLELCAVICHISPMALYRLVCAFGHQGLVTVLTRCGLPLPSYLLADEKHSHCLTDKVYLPTIVSGRVIWHLGYTEEASATAFTQSYQVFQRAAAQQEPSYRVKGVLTDGFDSTTKSMRTLFPGVRLGNCLRHAINKLPGKLMAIPSAVRKTLRSQFHTLWYRARQRKGLRVFALGQRLRHCVDHVTLTAGTANGERVRRWIQEKKAGWYAVLADPQMPVTRTLLDQAHNAIERNLFAMKGFHHPGGSQQAFLTGLAHLYNLIPYQRRAQHAGQCGVEVEGGRVPTGDWFLNLQILTSGGFRGAITRSTT